MLGLWIENGRLALREDLPRPEPPPALQMLARGDIQVDDLVTARYPLAEGVEAFKRAQGTDALKVLITAAR